MDKADIQKVLPTGAEDLWCALEQAAPELAVVIREHPQVRPAGRYSDYPGFREFLLVEFALNTPDRLLRDKLRTIRDEQVEAGVKPWPPMSSSQVGVARRDLTVEWRPIRTRIEASIEQIGVMRKQNRLLALQTLAEELADRMFEERNEKTGQFYLQETYLKVLHQVAEEMGDLGQPIGDPTGGLMEIAKNLAEAIKVQGSGIQEHIVEAEAYDYEEGEYAEVELQGESPDLQKDGVQA